MNKNIQVHYYKCTFTCKFTCRCDVHAYMKEQLFKDEIQRSNYLGNFNIFGKNKNKQNVTQQKHADKLNTPDLYEH